GYYLEPGTPACLCEQLQTLFLESLKIVGRSPGFVRAAPKHLRSRASNGFSRLHQLVVALDRARASHDYELRSTNLQVAELYDSVHRFQLAADEFVGLRNRDNVGNAWRRNEGLKVVAAVSVAYSSDYYALLASDYVRRVADPYYRVTNMLDLFFGRFGFHGYNHILSSNSMIPVVVL